MPQYLNSEIAKADENIQALAVMSQLNMEIMTLKTELMALKEVLSELLIENAKLRIELKKLTYQEQVTDGRTGNN